MAVNTEYAGILLENIAKLNNDAEKVTLVSGKDGQRMKVHRVILAAISNYFATILGPKLAGESGEIVLADLDGTLLRDLVAYFYTGNIQISAQNLKIYMDVASKFEFDLLQEKCAECQSSPLSIGNCVDWFVFAVNADVRDNALQTICKHFKDISTQELGSLDYENFKKVICTDDITASEEIIFDRLVEWTRFDVFDRSKYVSDLLKCIRLKLIPTKTLIEKVDVFCDEYNLNTFTKKEIHARLLNPQPLIQYCRSKNKSIFSIDNDSPNRNIRRYNDVTERWEHISSIGIVETRGGDGILFCHDRMVVMGGCSGPHYLKGSIWHKSVTSLDLVSKTCKQLPDMIHYRTYFSPIEIDQFIYVIGGLSPKNSIPISSERFNIVSGKWQNISPMLFEFWSNESIATMNGFIFIAGMPFLGDDLVWSVQRYDTKKDEWLKVATVSKPGFDGVLVEWNGLLYAVGVDEDVQVHRYDCQKNKWMETLYTPTREDKIVASFPKLQLSQFDSEMQLVIKDFDFFNLYQTADSKVLSLKTFTDCERQ